MAVFTPRPSPFTLAPSNRAFEWLFPALPMAASEWLWQFETANDAVLLRDSARRRCQRTATFLECQLEFGRARGEGEFSGRSGTLPGYLVAFHIGAGF
jgi:hypothetical protein